MFDVFLVVSHASTQRTISMNSAEISAFHKNKNRQEHSKNVRFQQRIREEMGSLIRSRHLHFKPFIFIDDGSFEAETFLLCCRNKRCLFHVLFENVFVCPNHLCIHHCKPNSHTCVLVHGKRGSVCCMFSGKDLSTHSAIGMCELLLYFTQCYH